MAIPKEAEPIVFTPLGVPADAPERKNRRSLSELVRNERFDGRLWAK
jgi:hypothetical protein